MAIITIELIMVVVLGIALINVLKAAKNEYAEGATYQIKVNAFSVTRDFHSSDEARAFAHAIAKKKAEEGEFVFIIRAYAIGTNKPVAPIGMKAAFAAGAAEYAKGYNKVTLTKWW